MQLEIYDYFLTERYIIPLFLRRWNDTDRILEAQVCVFLAVGPRSRIRALASSSRRVPSLPPPRHCRVKGENACEVSAS